MKKLILFLSLLVMTAAMGLYAQPGSTTYAVKADERLMTFPVLAADVVDATGETLTKIFDLRAKNALQYFVISVDIDTTSHTAKLHSSVNCVLAGSYDGANTFTTITTVPFHATADTTFAYTDVTTGVAYTHLRFTIAGLDSLGVQLMRINGRFLQNWDK